MTICPACKHSNLPGVEHCEECGMTLVHAERNSSSKEGVHKRIISDPILKVTFRDPVLTHPKATVGEVIRKMKENQVGCALIIDQQKLLGIFTERDVLKKLAKPGVDIETIAISTVMTCAPRTLEETDSISYALNNMTNGNYRHVAIRRRDGSLTSFAGVDMLRYLF